MKSIFSTLPTLVSGVLQVFYRLDHFGLTPFGLKRKGRVLTRITSTFVSTAYLEYGSKIWGPWNQSASISKSRPWPESKVSYISVLWRGAVFAVFYRVIIWLNPIFRKIVILGLKIVLKNIRNILFTSFSGVEWIFLPNAINLSSLFQKTRFRWHFDSISVAAFLHLKVTIPPCDAVLQLCYISFY